VSCGKKSELLQTSREVGKEISKTALARELGVCRSSLYYDRKMERRNEELRQRIEEVMLRHPAYGHRRIADDLKVNRKAVLRVMHLYQLKPARRCKTPSKPLDRGIPASEAPDMLKRVSPVAPSYIWTSDFSFIPFQGRFVYLCVVRDAFTKEVLGHSVRLHHTSELVLSALKDAFARRPKEAPTWLHSDQGSEYRSKDVERELLQRGIKPSYAPTASPWRNGAQESFFGRMKVEFGDFDRFDSLGTLVEGIHRYLAYYNEDRIYTTLRMSPAEFRLRWQERQTASDIGYSSEGVPSVGLEMNTT